VSALPPEAATELFCYEGPLVTQSGHDSRLEIVGL